MGVNSSGAAAFTMAWFHPALYHRMLAYSPTMVNQQWPWDPALPGSAWEYRKQFTFARNARHVDRPTVAQTMPAALEWLWKGYPIRLLSGRAEARPAAARVIPLGR